MRIAVLSDVHGNRIALDAVAAHLRKAAPDVVVNLGDLVSGPFDPAGCADLLMSLGYETIAGNHERQLLEGGAGFSDAFARPRLTNAHLDWIAKLPTTLTLAGGEVFACHGVQRAATWNTSWKTLLLAGPHSIPRKPSFQGSRASETRASSYADTPTYRALLMSGILMVNPEALGCQPTATTHPFPMSWNPVRPTHDMR